MPYTGTGRLEGLLDLGEVVALAGHKPEKVLVERGIHLRRPAEDPQILPAGVTDDSPRIVGGKPDDPIGPTERPEEPDLELGVGCPVDQPGLAAHLAHVPVERPLATGVDDLDVSVLSERVLGRHAHAALLEPLGNGCDLVPGAKVSLEVDRGDDLEPFRASNW